MDKATPTPSPASADKQAALVAKLRYMGKQYAAGQVARGGSPQKHYLEEAADEIEMMAWALSMNTKTPASAQENADLRNVIQAACIDGLPGLSRAWEKYFPSHPITIKGAEVERLAAQAAPTEEKRCACNDRPASGCPGEWEPGCDLGSNPKYVRVGQSPAQAPVVHAGEYPPRPFDNHFDQAFRPDAAQAVRMLTDEEKVKAWNHDCNALLSYADAVIRAFCAVNAGKRIPASGEIGGV